MKKTARILFVIILLGVFLGVFAACDIIESPNKETTVYYSSSDKDSQPSSDDIILFPPDEAISNGVPPMENYDPFFDSSKIFPYSDAEEYEYYCVNGPAMYGEVNLTLLGRDFEYVIENDEIVLLSYIGSSKNVIIPDGVKRINKDVFHGIQLTTLKVPSTIMGFEDGAFSGIHSLQTLSAPIEVLRALGTQPRLTSLRILWGVESDISTLDLSGYKTIKNLEIGVPFENCSFSDFRNLQIVTISTLNTNIPAHAFENCDNLSKVYANKVETIGDYAFKNCVSLKDVLPAKKIGNNAYENCYSINDYTFFFDPVEEIGNNAFMGCTSLRAIYFRKGIGSIGDGAFLGCSSLHTVEMPGVVSIGEKAFLGSDINYSLPETLRFIGKNAFGSENTVDMDFAGTLEQWEAIEKEDCFSSAFPRPRIQCSDGYVAGEEIAQYEFKDDGTLSIVSYYHPQDYRGLLTIPARSPFYDKPITEIKGYSFRYFYGIDELVISEGITTIREGALSFPNLLQITIPSSVTTLEENAVYSDSPKFIHIINKSALNIDISYLAIGEISSTRASLVETVSDESQFIHPLVWDENGVCLLFDGEDEWLMGYRGEAKDLDLSQYSYTKMMNYAMWYNDTVETLTLPGTSDIAAGSFIWAKKLKKVIISKGVGIIHHGAFKDCDALTEIFIPNSVRKIESYTFWDSENLQKIHLGSGISVIEEDVIDGPDHITIYYNGNKKQWQNVLKNNKWIIWHSSFYTIKYAK